MRTILIVEDTPLQLKWLVAIFKKQFHVLAAKTGLEAQQLFQNHIHDIDIMILDVRLPDMTAFELLNSFEKLYFAGIPPVVVQTEYDDKVWMQEMFGEHRTLHYLIKPFGENEIKQSVQMALQADPCLYKGAQLEERLVVMGTLGKIRGSLYNKIMQLPEPDQQQQLSRLLSLFHTYGYPEDGFPSGSKDNFQLTASLVPVFELVTQFYPIQIPVMEPFKIGVSSAFSSLLKGVLSRKDLEKLELPAITFERVETEIPQQEEVLDFWVDELNLSTLTKWKKLSPLFLPYQNSNQSPVIGVAVIQAQEEFLLKEAIAMGVPCVVIKTQDFEPRLYKLLCQLAKRKHELKVLKKIVDFI